MPKVTDLILPHHGLISPTKYTGFSLSARIAQRGLTSLSRKYVKNFLLKLNLEKFIIIINSNLNAKAKAARF